MTKPFSEQLRYEIPLTPDSVVIDVGGYEGAFTEAISKKYNCWIFCFEPVKRFYDQIVERTKGLSKVVVLNLAVGGTTRQDTINVRNDSSGFHQPSGEQQIVDVVSISDVLKNFAKENCDLLKLNCEASEFEIMESILRNKLAPSFKRISVQFHSCVPDARVRRDTIREKLRQTHDEEYCEPFVWEGHVLRK